jgi:hypothetical protein
VKRLGDSQDEEKPENGKNLNFQPCRPGGIHLVCQMELDSR